MRITKRVLLFSVFFVMNIQNVYAQDAVEEGYNRTPGNALVMLVGDDLIASKGIEKGSGLAAKIKQLYDKNGYHIDVVSRARVGMTTQELVDGVETVILKEEPDVLLVQIGHSDYRMNVPAQTAQYNLDLAIWKLLKADPDLRIVLMGDYFSSSQKSKQQNKIYSDMFKIIAGKYQIPLYPHFRAVTVGTPILNIDGHIHPTSYGMNFVLKDMTPYIHPYISEASTRVYFDRKQRLAAEEESLSE